MSDPVTNVEIEDVLSSIRRLVSNDERAAVAARSEPAPEPEKLVLTPQLRVDDAAEESVEGHLEQADEAEFDNDDWAVEAGENDDDHRDEFDAEGFENAGDDAESELREWHEDQQGDDHRDDVEDYDSFDLANESSIEEKTAEDDSVELDRSQELKDRVAEFEQLVARKTDNWEPDGQTSDEYSGGPVEPLPWEDYIPEEDRGEEQDVTEGDADAETGEDDNDVHEAYVENADTAEDDAQGEEPSDETAETVLAEDAEVNFEERPAEFVHEEIAPTVAEPEAAKAQNEEPDYDDDENALERDDLSGGQDDAVLDEEALRDLVAEIVRQELQGALGERITRNVRKLVRREIHRALSSQDLD